MLSPWNRLLYNAPILVEEGPVVGKEPLKDASIQIIDVSLHEKVIIIIIFTTGECVISLKDMFTEEPCYFEATMTHFGEETGKMK